MLGRQGSFRERVLLYYSSALNGTCGDKSMASRECWNANDAVGRELDFIVPQRLTLLFNKLHYAIPPLRLYIIHFHLSHFNEFYFHPSLFISIYRYTGSLFVFSLPWKTFKLTRVHIPSPHRSITPVYTQNSGIYISKLDTPIACGTFTLFSFSLTSLFC